MALTERYRHDGVDYWWQELAYMPYQSQYSLLGRRIREQVNVGARGYYVEGLAKYQSYSTASGGRLQVHVVSSLEADALEVHLFMPDEPRYRALTAGIRRGTKMAFFSRMPSVLSQRDEVALGLEHPSHLMAWE